MSFTADKQTLDDLNIPGKYKGSSIFHLFDRTHTRCGGQMLGAMFQAPLTDAVAINARSSIFRYFQDKALRFPVNKEQCEAAEQYLGSAGPAGMAGTALLIGRKKLMHTIGADKEYELIHAGILSTIGFLNDIKDFYSKLGAGKDTDPYGDTIREVKQALGHPALQKLLAEKGTPKLPLLKVIQYDHLLRHSHLAQLKRILAILYETDVYITVSTIARERKFTYATALPFVEGKNRIDMVDVYHPQLPGAVANTVYTNYEHNMIFLTGANMAGKSTFMKAFGIAVYLAHMGFPVAAERMEFSVQDGIYTSINVPDNLNMGYSHFYAEVLRVKEVATAVSRSQNLVIIFDELFKGTNVKDAYDATVAVTEALGENSNVTFIVSTHIVEAGETLRERCANMQFVFFPTIMDKQIPRYTYQLQEGISADRHGMMIITNEGIVDIIRGKVAANS